MTFRGRAIPQTVCDLWSSLTSRSSDSVPRGGDGSGRSKKKAASAPALAAKAAGGAASSAAKAAASTIPAANKAAAPTPPAANAKCKAEAIAQPDVSKSPASAKCLATPKVVVASTTVAIDDVSLSEESGWRSVDKARVAELIQIFEEGQYGVNLLKKPSLLYFGQRLSCKDGAWKLADGKHAFSGLVRHQEEV